MSEWWSDRNLRTARSLREAGMREEWSDPHPGATVFALGFVTGVLACMVVVMLRYLA